MSYVSQGDVSQSDISHEFHCRMAAASDPTDDAVLGGVEAPATRTGHRVGHDAILLAARRPRTRASTQSTSVPAWVLPGSRLLFASRACRSRS